MMHTDKPQAFIAGVPCDLRPESLEEAVAGLDGARSTVRKLSSHDRAGILDRLAASVGSDIVGLAQELSTESGYLSVADMMIEVQRAVEVFTLTAAYVRIGLSEALNVDAVDRARNAIGYIRREPIGPILGITAYNGPLLIAAHKIAPAIGAGAPILIKPSPRVAGAAIRLAAMVVKAGWPGAAIAVLDVDNDTTMALVRDPRLPVISFTGGEFGWTIKEAVPRKRVHLELGGVGAVYIARDGNVALAAKECAAGGYVRSGQSCISVQRVYVDRTRYDQFVRLFVSAVEELSTRPSESRISPMVDEAAARRAESLIHDASVKGAAIACGGQREGAYLAPTVLTGATDHMMVMRKEAFGPVVAVSGVQSPDEAIAEINAVSGAIHHGVYTTNIDLAMRFCDEVRAGGVIVNGPGTWRVDHMPYGGTGTSGFGREGVRFAIEEFTERKVIIVRQSEM